MDASSRLTVQFETKLVSLDKKLDLVNSGLSAVKVKGKKRENYQERRQRDIMK